MTITGKHATVPLREAVLAAESCQVELEMMIASGNGDSLASDAVRERLWDALQKLTQDERYLSRDLSNDLDEISTEARSLPSPTADHLNMLATHWEDYGFMVAAEAFRQKARAVSGSAVFSG